jgi:hypothetical protein
MADDGLISVTNRRANIPAFGRILLLFKPLPTIVCGIHGIPLLQMLLNIINQPDNNSSWHLSCKPEYAVLHHQRASAVINSNNSVEVKLVKNHMSGQLSVNCYMHGKAVLSGEPMSADLQHLNSL